MVEMKMNDRIIKNVETVVGTCKKKSNYKQIIFFVCSFFFSSLLLDSLVSQMSEFSMKTSEIFV